MPKYEIEFSEDDARGIGLKKAPQTTVNLEARKTMAGDFVIFDHVDMDIVIKPQQKKIIAFPKENMHDYVYDSQNRLFHHLSRRGVVERGSIQGANVYGAIEGTISEAKDEVMDPIEMSIFSIARFIDKERPHFDFARRYDDMIEDDMTEPPPDESTALGKVPQEPRKGTVLPNARPYDLMYKMYESEER